MALKASNDFLIYQFSSSEKRHIAQATATDKVSDVQVYINADLNYLSKLATLHLSTTHRTHKN